MDTSVWADLLNGYPSEEGSTLATMIEGNAEICTCGIVVSEVFQGLRRPEGREPLARLFRRLIFLEPSGIDTYFRAAEVYRRLRERGLTVRSTIDCVVAALAEEYGCFVLARDKDLRRIAGSGLVRTRLWIAATDRT